MAEAVADEDLAPAPGAEVKAPPGAAADDEDLAPAPGAAIQAPVADEDLAFLKPGFKRSAQPAAPDRIGQANQDYARNTRVLNTSAAESLGRGALQGASMGWGDEVAALADTLISKLPGVRRVAEGLADTAGGRGGSIDYSNPNLTYAERRDAYRAKNAEAKEANPLSYGAGEVAGGLATAAAPGMSLAKGAGALKVGLQGAALGGAAAAGESEATDAKQLLKDTGEGAALAGLGGVALHGIASKGAKLLATKIPALADRQAVAALTEGAPKSLTAPMTADKAGLSAAINEDLSNGALKTPVTLADIAGRKAEDVRPIVQHQAEKVGQALGGVLDKSKEADLADIVRHYDAEVGKHSRSPGNAKFIKGLEDARQEAIEHWGPTEEAIEARKGEIGQQLGKVYEAADKKTGGVTLGDLVKHYDDQIAQLSKQPGNEPYLDSLAKARNSAVNAWGKRPVFNPDAVVDGGPFGGAKAGDAVAKLEKMAQTRPQAASDLSAEAQRIRDAATSEGIDPTVKIPSNEVRAYATKLQDEGATSAADPKLAARARQFLGTTTKDFVNGHVEQALGPKDRQALEALNGRISNLYRWPEVVSGANADPAVRDAVLKEFGQKVSPRALDEYASLLEKRGTQNINKLTPGEISDAKANLAEATRDFVDTHAAKGLSPADLAAYKRLGQRRTSLGNIDKVLERREMGEQASKIGLASKLTHGAGGLVAMHQLGTAGMHALAGDIGGAATHLGTAAAATVAPHLLTKTLPAIGRAAVRGAARGTDLLATIAARAEAGNPWARRQIDLLRSTPAGAARLAAAVARMRGPAAEQP